MHVIVEISTRLKGNDMSSSSALRCYAVQIWLQTLGEQRQR